MASCFISLAGWRETIAYFPFVFIHLSYSTTIIWLRQKAAELMRQPQGSTSICVSHVSSVCVSFVLKECPSFALFPERGFNSSTCFKFGAKLDRGEKDIWRTSGILCLFRKLIAEWQKSLEYKNFRWRNIPFKQIVGYTLTFLKVYTMHCDLTHLNRDWTESLCPPLHWLWKNNAGVSDNWSTSYCQHVRKITYKDNLITSFI